MPLATLINIDRIAGGSPAVATDMVANLQSLRDACNGIDAEQINASAITTGKLAASSVITAKIADGALSSDAAGRAKMASLFVTAAKLAADACETAKIKDEAVTVNKIAPSSLVQLATGSYTGNGSATGPSITGVGFTPTAVFILQVSSNKSYFGFTGDGSTALYFGARSLWDNGGGVNADFALVNSDGFDIKLATGPNNNTTTYYYIAFGLNT
jgi:hypothetical protein